MPDTNPSGRPAQAQNTKPQKDAGSSEALVGVLAHTACVEDSILSKVPLENDVLQLTLLAIAKGQALSEHTSPKAVVATVLDGELEFIVEGKTHDMHAGDSVYLAPGAVHALTATKDTCLQLVMVNC